MTYAMKFDASLLCRASFPAELEDDGGRCIVEVTVYRAKRARVRKKYRNRIRRAFFAALASEGGGSS